MHDMLVIIDGNALMHRAYHGVNRGFIPMWEGMPVGMVFGFASTLLSIIDHFNPEQLLVAFDTKEKTFRHEMDANYKAHREKAPDDFYPQVPFIEELLEAFDIPILKCPGYESDDIIGTVARAAEKKDQDVIIMSGDLDFLQLVDHRIRLAKFNGKIEQSEIYGPEETYNRYGIHPEQMIDYKAIIGDSSDNYKGIPGIGPKTAAKLLQEHNTLNNIFEQLESLPDKLRDKFMEYKSDALHCQELAAIHTQVPIEFSLSENFDFTPETSLAFFEKMKFQSLKNRYQKLIFGKNEPEKEAKTEPQMSLF